MDVLSYPLLTFHHGVVTAPVKKYASGRRSATVDLVSLRVGRSNKYWGLANVRVNHTTNGWPFFAVLLGESTFCFLSDLVWGWNGTLNIERNIFS